MTKKSTAKKNTPAMDQRISEITPKKREKNEKPAELTTTKRIAVEKIADQNRRALIAEKRKKVLKLQGVMAEGKMSDSKNKRPTSLEAKRVRIFTLDILCLGCAAQVAALDKNHKIEECRRIIEMSERQTFHDLHLAIQDYFDFDDDHLYGFCLGKSPHDEEHSIGPQGTEMDSLSEEVKLGERLKKGKTFFYTYDFGDEWEFTIKVSGVREEPPSKIKYPSLMDAIGESPEQYPDFVNSEGQ